MRTNQLLNNRFMLVLVRLNQLLSVRINQLLRLNQLLSARLKSNQLLSVRLLSILLAMLVTLIEVQSYQQEYGHSE